MYTRRLYYIDEVRSAFLYSLKQKRILEAFFWLEELEDSNYGVEARRLLFIAWLMWIGISNLEWLHLWSTDATSREGRLNLCWKLMRLTNRDASIWNLLWAPFVSKDIKQTELVERWNSMRNLDSEKFWEVIVNSSESEKLDTIYESLQMNMKYCTIFAKCSAVVLMKCDLPKDCWKELSIKEYPDMKEAAEWKKIKNARKRRIYSIPYDCLFGMTWRGTGVSTLENIRELSYKDLKDSPSWKVLCKAETDEDLEEFWDTYFPWTSCDHPSEWSLSDQKKSHGDGSTGSTASLERWWRNWCVSETILKDIISENMLKKYVYSLPGNTDGKSILDRLVKMYEDL
jgi:hypothetical protein